MFEFASDTKKSCDLSVFNESTVPFAEANHVVIDQKRLIIKKGTPPLCEIFPNIHELELNFEYLNDPGFIDCEFDLLDDFTVGGKLLDKTFEKTFENLLKKNTRIQQITLKSPTSYRTYQLIQKYLKYLNEISIFDNIIENDDESSAQEEIFIPSVRKLKIHLSLGSGCHLPMAVIFGGLELRELDLKCYEGDRNYKYFSTLYRYRNIKSLWAHDSITDRELLKIVGKFPLLEKAHFSFQRSVKSESIFEFIEECDHLKHLWFFYPKGANQPESEIKEQLEMRIDDGFEVVSYPSHDFRMTFNGSSAPKFVTSGIAVFLMAIHICRAFLF